MVESNDSEQNNKLPESSKAGKIARSTLQVVGGAIPYVGGLCSIIASAYSENEQAKANRFLEHWLHMLEAEIKEQEQTIIEVMARLDLQDEKITKRVESPEYHSLIRKTFREWSGAESAEKRVYIRNILANAASTDISSDDVIRLYIDWINKYSELHFVVIAKIYKNQGLTRGKIWKSIGKKEVRENSAEADLYRLLFRDLSTGGIIRQHRETDYHGNFIPTENGLKKTSYGNTTMKSAFDDQELYELTELGQQFIHYAMTDLPLKITFDASQNTEQ